MASIYDRMKKAKAAREQRFNNTSKNPAVYPILDLQIGQSVLARFLPALDPVYDEPWTTRKLVPMVFNDPEAPNDATKTVRFRAPCLEMYGPQYVYQGLNKPGGCPVARKVRELYTEAKALKEAGRTTESARIKGVADRHWISKNTNHYYQGFILKSPIVEKTPPENPIRIMSIMAKLHKKFDDDIYNNTTNPFKAMPFGDFSVEDCISVTQNPESLTDEQALAIVTGFEGYAFAINVVPQGKDERNNDKPYREWAAGSGWDRDKSSLTDEQVEAIAKYGYHDLRSILLPPQPSAEKYERFCEMMDKSIARLFEDGDGMWDPEWEKPFASGEAGCEPYRPKDKDKDEESEEEGSAGTSTRSTSTAAKSSASSSVASRLASLRGKKTTTETASAPAETKPTETKPTETKPTETTATAEVPAEPPVETKQAETPATVSPKAPPDVIADIRNRMKKKNAATPA